MVVPQIASSWFCTDRSSMTVRAVSSFFSASVYSVAVQPAPGIAPFQRLLLEVGHGLRRVLPVKGDDVGKRPNPRIGGGSQVLVQPVLEFILQYEPSA